MKHLLSLFVALVATTSLWASNVITYTATEKLTETTDEYSYGLHTNAFNVAITSHTFSNGTGTITFAGEVTTIGDHAFYKCSGLTSVTIGNSVTTIGKWAFEYCSNLTSITIPNSVTTIGRGAFLWCTALTSITIPNSVTTIGESAFINCTSLPVENNLRYADTYLIEVVDKTLSTYSIKKGTKWIGEDAFRNCKSLTSITIPNSVTTIGWYAFYDCSGLTSVTIGNSVKTIGYGAFKGCTSLPVENNLRYADTYLIEVVDKTLSTYSIKKGTKWIGEEAFCGCKGLTSITIPNSVTTLGNSAFNGCSSLTSVTIGNSVTTIVGHAFEGCAGLTSINVDASNTHYSSVDGVLFNYAKDVLILYPKGNKRTKYTIPNSVTTIEKKAFAYCKNLTSITIPNSVTTIEKKAFAYCEGLTSINVDASNTHYRSVDGVLFNYAKDVLIQYPIGNTRTEYIIPNSVTTIEDRAFEYCSNLTSITIPNSVTTIGWYAFYDCSGLTSITIPNSVTTIGWGAFYDCSGLTSVFLLNPNIKIDVGAFKNCSITDLYCGTSVDLSEAEGEIKNIHRLNDEEFLIFLPFDQYARQYVEPQINEWQKKGEFEKTTDWQKRVNETTRKQQIDSLVLIAKKDYLANYQKNNNRTFTLGSYDADNEVYLIQTNHQEDLLVAVPIAEASYVKQNWESHTASPQYDIQGTEVFLTSVTFIFPNNKTYSYRSNQKLTYSTPDINYNFDPIELPEMQTVTMGGAVAQSPQAPQSISEVIITTPVAINEMSSVLVTYKNMFGKYEMPEKDEPFPFTLIRLAIKGDAKLVRLATQSLSLDMGQFYATEQTVPLSDKILFLVSSNVKNIYLVDSNGQRQLLYSGWLLPNKIYDGTIEVK